MKIILIADVLIPGGVEWFVLRLFREFHNRGHEVKLVVMQPEKIDKRLLKEFPEVRPIHAHATLVKLFLLLDGILNKVFKKTFFHAAFSAAWLKKLIKAFQPDVLHSHFLFTDNIVVKANKNAQVRHVVTMHGDYVARIKKGMNKTFPLMQKVLTSSNAVVVISEEQKKLLSQNFPFIVTKMKKIYNGYSYAKDETNNEGKKNVFTFGMIARGIPVKGWQIAIDAFSKIKRHDIRLLLYGESSFLSELKIVNTDSRIIFAGFTNQPLKAIALFDVGLFPSYYSNESLPTTIIEYLILHKPVLTTAVGECELMIDYEGELAGKIIPMEKGIPSINALSQAMIQIIDDKEEYKKMVQIAAMAKHKFDMERCINQYLNVYNN